MEPTRTHLVRLCVLLLVFAFTFTLSFLDHLAGIELIFDHHWAFSSIKQLAVARFH
ncbi:hypothetical protein BDV06DRAFT_187310 [Aspergillus oleicola]